MGQGLKNELRELIEGTFVYVREEWATTAFKSRIEQYKRDFSSKNFRAPIQEEINKFVNVILKEDWIENGRALYDRTVDEIIEKLFKYLTSYKLLKNLKDRALAVCVLTVSLYALVTIYKRDDFSVLYGTIGIAALVCFIFGAKVIWSSISLRE